MPKTPKRRRRENRTDYKARFAMLKSEKPRLVVRKSNRYILLQLVSSDIAQDKVLMRASSKDLLSKGWPKNKEGSLKSLVAAYLAGYLLGTRAKEKFKEAILDTGLNRSITGSRLFAALKGASDAGLKIPHNPKALPTDEMLSKNEKTKDLIKLKEKI